MVEELTREKEPFRLSPDQIKLALRALDTILPQLKQIYNEPSEEIRAVYLRRVFGLPVLQELFEEKGINIKDEPEVIQSKLEALIQELQAEKSRVTTEPQEPETASIRPFIPEEVREPVMNIQADLNELYKKRDSVVEEIPKLQEALARLEVFATGISDTEDVEVERSADGSVEVIFESDVTKAEALHAEAEDIKNSEERLAVYKREREEILESERGGFFQKLNIFQQEEAAPPSPRVTELDGKIMRTSEELIGRIATYKTETALLERRREDKKLALEALLTVTGTDGFVGTWRELSMMLRTGSQSYLKGLEESLIQYDEAIERFEQKRTDLIEEKK